MTSEKALKEMGVAPVDLADHPLAKVQISPAEMRSMLNRNRQFRHELERRHEERERRGNRVDPNLYNVVVN